MTRAAGAVLRVFLVVIVIALAKGYAPPAWAQSGAPPSARIRCG